LQSQTVQSLRAFRSWQLFLLAGTDIHSSRHRFFLYYPLAGAGDTTNFSRSTGSSTSLATSRYPPVQKQLTFDRHKPVPFRSDKTLTFSDGAIKRIIDTCLFQPVSSDTVPPLRKMGAAFCFDYNEMGVFRGGFASSSNLLFASVSHGGVLQGLLFCFRSIPYIWCLGRCALFLITEAATYPSSR
jgi:hypothetical protein